VLRIDESDSARRRRKTETIVERERGGIGMKVREELNIPVATFFPFGEIAPKRFLSCE